MIAGRTYPGRHPAGDFSWGSLLFDEAVSQIQKSAQNADMPHGWTLKDFESWFDVEVLAPRDK